jgi:hypothetical protein
MTDPFDTFTTKWECDQALQRWGAREEDRRKKDPTTRYYYRCLLDTVDPRGGRESERERCGLTNACFRGRFSPEIPDEDGICGEEDHRPQKSR